MEVALPASIDPAADIAVLLTCLGFRVWSLGFREEGERGRKRERESELGE